MQVTWNQKLLKLLGWEALLLVASCLFLLTEFYYDWYNSQRAEEDVHKVMALGQYLIGLAVSTGFGIWLLMLVRSFLHFFVGLCLVIVQLWISFVLCFTGTYEIDWVILSGLVYYAILTIVHIWLALRWMKTLTLRKKALNGEAVEF